MGPESTQLWQHRLQVAEQAMGGSPEALAALGGEVVGMRYDMDLLSTPQDASDMSYFLALLRELVGPAQEEFTLAVRAIRRWMEERRVPTENRCVVHNRLATVLTESGQFAEALEALETADPKTPKEEAYTLAQLGMVEARLDSWGMARQHAERAVRLAAEADDSAAWLDVRMRAAHVLFQVHYRNRGGPPADGQATVLAQELQDLCGRQIDRWGSEHPRALEALVIMTEAQHMQAQERDDVAAMGRLTDVLAVAAQRSASLLGARHPQAKAARAALENATQAEERHQNPTTSRPRSAPQGAVARHENPWQGDATEALAGATSGGKRARDRYLFGESVTVPGGAGNIGIVGNQTAAASAASRSHRLREAIEELLQVVEEQRDYVAPEHAQILDESLSAIRGDTTAPEERHRALMAVVGIAVTVGTAGSLVQQLSEVVRALEGRTYAELDRLLSPIPSTILSHGRGLTAEEEHSARELLERADESLSGGELRDALTEELNGISLPSGFSPSQLFQYVLDLPVQPDGLPPAVLLVECAAQSAGAPGPRRVLSRWAENWAQRAGLLAVLERRRAERTGVYDPSIPICLVIVVEHVPDDSGDILVRPWCNAVPGRWNPQPGESVTTTLDGLGAAVGSALRQGSRLWSVQREPDSGGRMHSPPYVEFVLPDDLLNYDVAGLTYQIGDERPLPLGLKYGVHVRSLERMRDSGAGRQQWRERWRALRTQGVKAHGWSESYSSRLHTWQATLAMEPDCTAVVLDAPDGGPATSALKVAMAEGIGVAVWDRRGKFSEERREVVNAVFASVSTPDQIPIAIHRLRQRAETHNDGASLLGRHIAFMWDDPTRLVELDSTDNEESEIEVN